MAGGKLDMNTSEWAVANDTLQKLLSDFETTSDSFKSVVQSTIAGEGVAEGTPLYNKILEMYDAAVNPVIQQTNEEFNTLLGHSQQSQVSGEEAQQAAINAINM